MGKLHVHFQKFHLMVFIASMFNSSTDGAKILGMFAYPAKSHFTFNSAILKSLANAGHEITVFTSFPGDIAGENYTVIDTSNEFSIQVGNTTYNEFSKFSAYSILTVAFNHEKPLCEKLWKRKEIQDMMNSEEKLFDVIFVEIFFVYKCMLPLAHKMKIPVIGTATYKSWLMADLALNNPNNPAYIPYESSVYWNPNDLYERLRNVWNHITVYYVWNFITVPFLTRFYRDNYQQVVSYAEYMNMEPSVIFYNTHHSFVSRPMNPNAVEVGGIHINSPKPLTKRIKKFIEDAPNGVILFTFGSLIKTSTLPSQVKETIFNVLAELPQKVIMKYESVLENVPENVMILEWLPQRDILEHENVIAFISHCGQGGVYEAIYTGTPMVALPSMFDQRVNAIYLEKLGVAVNLDLDFLTEDMFRSALDSVINNKKFANNMKRLSLEFKDRCVTSQQSVVYWTEYVIRHNGANNLKPVSNELKWFQYLLIDVIIIILLIVVIVVYLGVLVFNMFYRLIHNFVKVNRKFSKKKVL